MSNNPSFNDVFELPGDRKTKITKGGRSVDRANEALAYLETLFPRSIGEVCPIDRTGAEAARVVEGDRAPVRRPVARGGQPAVLPAHVRPRPGLGLPGRAVRLAGHRRLGRVPLDEASGHRRHQQGDRALRDHRRQLPRGAATGSDVPVLVVDAATGAVIMDSRWPQAAGNIRGRHRGPGAPLGNPADGRFRSLRREDDAEGRRARLAARAGDLTAAAPRRRPVVALLAPRPGGGLPRPPTTRPLR
jgi:hypothetical protein